MSIVAKALINSKFASDAATSEYIAPAGTHTLIDKFTATNTDGSSQTITIYLIPSGGTSGALNTIVSAHSIASGATFDSTEIKNHVLNPGDALSVVANLVGVVVIRCSGREST